VPIIDNYWQTETGWPILTLANGVEQQTTRFGSPGKAMYGYNVKLMTKATGEELTGPTRRAWWPSKARCPPAACRPCGATTQRFVNTYWKSIPGR
jgi:propionyl-CoA synthetase